MQVSRQWRLRQQRYNLTETDQPQGSTLAAEPAYAISNGNGHHAPAAQVQQQTRQAVRAGALAGTVYSYTTVHHPPAGFEAFAPYSVALIELEDGRMITAQLTDLDGEPYIGMAVEMVTRKLRSHGPEGLIEYGYKFRPVMG